MITESPMTDCTVRQSGRLSHQTQTRIGRQIGGWQKHAHKQMYSTALTLISINKHLVVLKILCQTNQPTRCYSNPHLATSKLSSGSSVDTSYAQTHAHKLTPSKSRNSQPTWRLSKPSSVAPEELLCILYNTILPHHFYLYTPTYRFLHTDCTLCNNTKEILNLEKPKSELNL